MLGRRKTIAPLKMAIKAQTSRCSQKPTCLEHLRAVLPRQRPSRKRSAEVKEASKLYLRLHVLNGLPRSWHELARRLVPGYGLVGSPSIEQMTVAARERGYEYIGITDHSQNLKLARGVSVQDLLKQVV